MSYAVKRRTAELGVRMALGASQSRVLWTVLGESLLLVSTGLIAGVPIVVTASRLISRLLYEVIVDEPATIALAALMLVAVGAVSGYIPAHRGLIPSWRCESNSPLRPLAERM